MDKPAEQAYPTPPSFRRIQTVIKLPIKGNLVTWRHLVERQKTFSFSKTFHYQAAPRTVLRRGSGFARLFRA